jgi:hypothetical protein
VTNDPAIFGNHRVIFYQLEQPTLGGNIFKPERLAVLKRAEEIWDYSEENIAILKSQGFSNVTLLPLGFHEGLNRIAKAHEEIDLLFYGAMNQRRQEMLNRLSAMCRVESIFGI